MCVNNPHKKPNNPPRMSVRQNNSSNATTVTAAALTPMVDMTEASQDTALAEGSNYNVVSSDAPLKRNVVVSIKSTLNGTHSLARVFECRACGCILVFRMFNLFLLTMF